MAISVKIQKKIQTSGTFIPVYFVPSLMWFPLELGIGASGFRRKGSKKLNGGLSG